MLLISYNKLFNQVTVKRIICVMTVLKLKQLKAVTINSGSILHYVTIGTIISSGLTVVSRGAKKKQAVRDE